MRSAILSFPDWREVSRPRLREPLFDLRAGLRGADETEPVTGGAGVVGLGGDDLHDVARYEFGGQRHEAPVDLGAYTSMTDLRVDRIGEVHRSGAARQGAATSPSGVKHEDQVFVQVQL